MAILLVLSVGALAISCSRPVNPPEEGGELAYTEVSVAGGDSALVDGTLALDGGCLIVVAADQSRVIPIFKRTEVSWDGTRLEWSGNTWTVGDTVSLEGGFVDRPEDGDYVPSKCTFDDVFYVI